MKPFGEVGAGQVRVRLAVGIREKVPGAPPTSGAICIRIVAQSTFTPVDGMSVMVTVRLASGTWFKVLA